MCKVVGSRKSNCVKENVTGNIPGDLQFTPTIILTPIRITTPMTLNIKATLDSNPSMSICLKNITYVFKECEYCIPAILSFEKSMASIKSPYLSC